LRKRFFLRDVREFEESLLRKRELKCTTPAESQRGSRATVDVKSTMHEQGAPPL
jgi:hypothetical protein